MLFNDLEFANCTLATANSCLKNAVNSVNSLVFAEYNRLYEILIDSWSKQIDEIHKVRFGY